jgi:glutaminyl-tRNA synthetase
MPSDAAASRPPLDFIRQLVADDLRRGIHDHVVTRFPPEPNGYLHIGHAKSICLNFGLANEHPGGRCHLRFDDTNPTTEEDTYVRAIQEDVRWLGFDWGPHCYWASDYFGRLYDLATELIRRGLAYVDSLSADEIRAHRGTLTAPGRDSPYRDRSIEESLELFARMRAGAFPDGAHVLRARIDMAAANVTMRDPVLYRIRHASHHRTGDAWCLYPTYDFTHPLSDAFEGITHSLCTLEFAEHRPLYDWLLAALELPHPPKQTEFARLNVSYTVLSKRRLLHLVTQRHVDGWDDPRMPTLSGLRRRGYTPSAIRTFCDVIGLAKRDSLVDVAVLEHTIRDELNRTAPRVMAVLRPLRVVIENYPEDREESLEAVNNPEDPSQGRRTVPFGRVLYVEADDFALEPPPNYFRLAPGREVRLRWAYVVRCTGVVRDDDGHVVEVRCTYDPDSRGGAPADGRKVKGTIHWVAAAHAMEAEVRLYDRLFTVENPGEDYLERLNPASCEVLTGCKLEPGLATIDPETRIQFERLGYFRRDPVRLAGTPVFNRIVTLRDTWAKVQRRQAG